MHAAWNIPEVRDLVLNYLRPGDYARLARTCKEISSCVIDRLWIELNTLDAFLSLLPAYPRDEPLKLVDLKRLDFYGFKVRRLYLVSQEKRKVDVPRSMRTRGRWKNGVKVKASTKPWIELWAEIARLRLQTAFLPNLQHLRVDNVAAELLLPLIGISGTHLETVCIKVIHEPRDLVQKLLGSFEETPKLEVLFVRNGLPSHVPKALVENSPLVTLQLPPTLKAGFNGETWPLHRWMLTKSSLENLTLGLTAGWYGPDWEASGTKLLPALRQLTLNLRNITSLKCHQDCPSGTLPWTGNPRRVQAVADGVVPVDTLDCKHKPPSFFIRSLDHPNLELLNLKFNQAVDGALLLDTMKAVVDTCRLNGQAQLVLSNGGHLPPCDCHSGRTAPAVDRRDVWEMLKMLGHLPRLRTLRMPLACDFLRDVDMKEYKLIACAFPALQTLRIGHRSFAVYNMDSHFIYDRTPLRHVAAFCHLLPHLDDVEIGCVDATFHDKTPNPQWVCPHVRKLRVGYWVTGTDVLRFDPRVKVEWRIQDLQSYFPNADLTAKETLSRDQPPNH